MYKSIKPHILYSSVGGDGTSFCHLLRVFRDVTPPTVSELLSASVDADLGRAYAVNDDHGKADDHRRKHHHIIEEFHAPSPRATLSRGAA